MSEEKIGMYTAEEIYEELANGFLHHSMVDAMYFHIKDLQQKLEQLEKDYLDDYNRHLHNENEQLENIRKEAIEYVTKKWYSKNTEDINKMVSFGNWEIDLLNILNKGSEDK